MSNQGRRVRQRHAARHHPDRSHAPEPVTLDLTYHGTARDPWGNDKAVFSAEAEVDREEWGLTWNQALETGGVLVGKKAKIEIEVEAMRPAADPG